MLSDNGLAEGWQPRLQMKYVGAEGLVQGWLRALHQPSSFEKQKKVNIICNCQLFVNLFIPEELSGLYQKLVLPCGRVGNPALQLSVRSKEATLQPRAYT